MRLASAAIRGSSNPFCGFQGGMGAGISLATLAGTVAKEEGWTGIVSFVALDLVVERNLTLMPDLYESKDIKCFRGQRPNAFEATRIEIEAAKRVAKGGPILLNLMGVIQSIYKDSIYGAIYGGGDGFVSGAGLPLPLPGIVRDACRDAGREEKDILLIPIVSSGRALDIICRKWWKDFGRLPDAVVLEGPKAGGHLGFKLTDDLSLPEFQLEALFPSVLVVAQEYGNIPVIVAGGIWDHSDIIRYLEAGVAGVQIGTRLAATVESGASSEFKRRIVEATADDIIVARDPGSPSGMPFRILASSPGYRKALLRTRDLSQCDFCYMLRDGICPAMKSTDSFCICRNLWHAINDDPDGDAIYTVGANAVRVERIYHTKELIDELMGVNPIPNY